MTKTSSPPSEESPEVIRDDVRKKSRRSVSKSPPAEDKKQSPPKVPVKRRKSSLLSGPRGKRLRAEDSQIGSNIDRALEMTAKRQFENNEEGVAKLVQWLSAEVENKKNAERKIRSLLVRCERVEIPYETSKFGAVRLLIKELTSNTDHEEIVRLASQMLKRMNKSILEISIDDDDDDEKTEEAGDANESEDPPTAEESATVSTPEDGDSLQEKKRVRFSDQHLSDDSATEKEEDKKEESN